MNPITSRGFPRLVIAKPQPGPRSLRTIGHVRVLAACSLGGASHWQPLVPFLTAARDRGHETVVIGPPGLRNMVRRTGFVFHAGGEPDE